MAFYYDAAQDAHLHATQLYPGYGYWIYISAPDMFQLASGVCFIHVNTKVATKTIKSTLSR